MLSNGAGQDSFRVDTPPPHDFEHSVHDVYVIGGSITKKSIIKQNPKFVYFILLTCNVRNQCVDPVCQKSTKNQSSQYDQYPL